MPSYKVLVGINYPTAKGEVRAEPGDVVSDLPPKSAEWLAREGVIEMVQPVKSAKDGE